MTTGLDKAFGRHMRSLRRARGLTQEVLAERGGLSADTIRRLEHGSFSPSLDTLRKLCRGLDMGLATLFESFELAEVDEDRMLLDMLRTRPPALRRAVRAVVRSMVEELERDEEPAADANATTASAVRLPC